MEFYHTKKHIHAKVLARSCLSWPALVVAQILRPKDFMEAAQCLPGDGSGADLRAEWASGSCLGLAE